ncbi:MAG: trigger factor [Bacteroidetes bacterium]|nr:MAG: trigger factor [Bacteroidota bacterium]
MQTSVNKVTEVEFELEITATAEDLSPDLEKAIRAQKGRTTMKGFRPGHVPISLVKKVYGKSLAYGVAENAVQKTYEDQILKADEYDVLGQPTITDLTYEYEGDLRAVVKFGVRPDISLADFSSLTIYKLQHEVTEEEIQKEIDNVRAGRAELVPEDGPVTEDSVVTVDMQRLDADSQTPVVGEKQDGVSVLMSDENVLAPLKDALLGKSSGDTTNAVFPGPADDPDPRHYQVSVVAVKRRELPEFDDELVSELTSERLSTADEMREEMRRQLEDGWKRRGKDLFESDIVSKTIEIHEFSVPGSVVDMYLDSFVSDLKSQGEGKLPPHFDEDQFRELRKEEAMKQASWMFVRDKIIAVQKLEVTDHDRDEYLERTAGDGMDLDTIKKYYRAVPNMQEQLDQRLLSDKVFEWIGSQLTIEEKDLETYRELTKEAETETAGD